MPVFRTLWIAGLVSNIGSWMQTVGAQWLLVDAGSPPAVIALVQTAAAAPVLLLAIPAGVLGEFLNRRRLLIAVQAVQLGFVTILVVLSALGEATPTLLLALTFAIGAASAMQLPAYQAIVPDVVPKHLITDAASLSSIAVNLARAVGPAVAGLIVAQLGVTAVFIANAISFVFFLVVLLSWRSYSPPPRHPEPFLDATRAGIRYLRHSRIIRGYYLRLALFLLPANALWALLPVVANEKLRLGAAGYGILLAALGIGSVLGAFLLPVLRRAIGASRTVMTSMLLFGIALAALSQITQLWVALPLLVVAGLGWIGVIATINGAVQAFLPVWVRTRGLSLYQLVLFGCTAIGAAICGALATPFGAATVLGVAGGLVAALGIATLLRPLRSTSDIGRNIVAIAEVSDADEPDEHGDAVAMVRYTVPDEHRSAFVQLMDEVAQTRYRTGARGWQLLERRGSGQEFVEVFRVGSWREHVEQVRSRNTAYDYDLIQQARAFSTEPPTAEHYTPVHIRATRSAQ